MVRFLSWTRKDTVNINSDKKWTSQHYNVCIWPRSGLRPCQRAMYLECNSARTKASSLRETGALQGSIWQPGHWMSRVDDLEMKNANNASLLQLPWQEWANSIHTFLGVSLCLSFWHCRSPFTCHSVFPTFICSSPSPQAGKGGRRADRDTIRCLSAKSGCARQSSAVRQGVKQRVIWSKCCKTSCWSVHPLRYPPAMVLPSSLCLLHPNPSSIFLITKVAGIQKNLLTNCFLVYFPSTFPPSELKGDKSKEPLRLCGCVYAKGEAEGTHRANKTRFPLGPNLIIFCCRCQADGAAWFLI